MGDGNTAAMQLSPQTPMTAHSASTALITAASEVDSFDGVSTPGIVTPQSHFSSTPHETPTHGQLSHLSFPPDAAAVHDLYPANFATAFASFSTPAAAVPLSAGSSPAPSTHAASAPDCCSPPAGRRRASEALGPQLFSQQVSRKKYEVPSDSNEVAPSPRFGHTAIVHENDMILHGGRDANCLGDVWAFDFTTKKWREIPVSADGPSPRAGHVAVAHEHKMYVFGGVGSNDDANCWLNDTWCLDLETYRWEQIVPKDADRPSPSGRKGHTAVVCRDSMFVFGGGVDDKSFYNDLWEFDLKTHTWTERSLAGHCPVGRMYHVAVAVPGDRMVIFGGRATTETGFLNDVVELTLAPPDESCVCAELLPTGVAPSPRMCSTAVYHNQTLAIFTGGSYSYLDDSHQLDLRTLHWSPISDVTFGGRTRPTTVKWKNTVLTFGGCVHVNGYVNDFVEIELEPMTLLQTCREYILSAQITCREGLPHSLIEFLDS
ncbi:RING finger protein B [Diplonema papillatum]|nr:RING finger protein B [Diplonema papillatum]